MAQDMKEPHLLSSGTWLYVGGGGPGNYTKIQDALDNASNGDTVFVYDELSPYVEYLTIRQSITLRGEARDTTIINGIVGWRSMLRIIAQHVIVQGFSFIQHGADGVFIQSDNVTITGNLIAHIGWAAIDVEDATRINISDNIISDAEFGVFFYNSAYTYEDNIIAHNIIRNISENGIYLSGESNIIHNNDIAQINEVGMLLHEMSFSNISSNTVTSCTDGIQLMNSYQNTLYRNNLAGNRQFGLLVIDPSGDTVLENNFMNNAQNARIIFDLIGELYVHRVLGYPLLPVPTRWARNFWDAPRLLPYPIPTHLMFGLWIAGWLELFFEIVFQKTYVRDFVNFVRFDRNPSQEPYDIS